MRELPSRNDADPGEFVSRCLAGEERAWEELYGFVLSICRWRKWRLGDDADDVAAAVVLSLLDGGLEGLRRNPALRAYLYRVTVNRILDHLRRRGASPVEMRSFLPERVDNDAPGSSPLVEALRRDGVRTVLEAMDDLGSPCRELLDGYLAYRAGLHESYRELEGRFGRPANVLSVQIRRCLDRLRKHPRIRELAGSG